MKKWASPQVLTRLCLFYLYGEREREWKRICSWYKGDMILLGEYKFSFFLSLLFLLGYSLIFLVGRSDFRIGGDSFPANIWISLTQKCVCVCVCFWTFSLQTNAGWVTFWLGEKFPPTYFLYPCLVSEAKCIYSEDMIHFSKQFFSCLSRYVEIQFSPPNCVLLLPLVVASFTLKKSPYTTTALQLLTL